MTSPPQPEIFDEVVVAEMPLSEIVRPENGALRPQQRLSTNSLAKYTELTSAQDVPVVKMPSVPLRDDIIVHSKNGFWVEINPMSKAFDRSTFEIDEREFNVVGIARETDNGDNILYEVQFEDGHTATVYILFCH